MKNIRAALSPLALVALLIFHVGQSWTEKKPLAPIESNELSLEHRLVLMQGKLFIGAKSSLPQMFQGNQQLVSQLEKIITEISGQALKVEDPTSKKLRYQARYRALIAARLGRWDIVENQLSRLEESEREDSELTLDGILIPLLREQRSGKQGHLSETDELVLNEMLQDFSELAFLEEDLSLNPEFVSSAEKLWHRFFLGIVVFSSLLGIGLLVFLVISALYLSGKLRSRYHPPHFPAHLLGESFVLYLLAMIMAPRLLFFLMEQGLVTNPLVGNIVLILSTVIAILWPLGFGARLGWILRATGVYLGGFGKFIADLLIAPLFYLGNWIVLLSVLLVYSVVLSRFNIDMSQGAHPIVPMLLEGEDAGVRILIVILATLVAPLIEEIMFRGVLYGYLRTLMRPLPAIFLSSLCFAVVHPQGVLGVVPLTAIGMMLATLREWRGSLIAPIIAHACVNGGTLAMLAVMFG
jgi:membrane protease YdiL (CAAX protease family)